jgi:hypothetical protein
VNAAEQDEGIHDPFKFGPSMLAVGDAAVYCPGHGWAQRATVTGVTEGRMHYLVETPAGDVGSGCWHSELHSPAEFIARGGRGELGPTVMAAVADVRDRGQGGDVAAVCALLEPATFPPDPAL